MTNALGFLTDRTFWGDIDRNLGTLPQDAMAALQRYGNLPAQASYIADKEFPDSARDSSTKNAFRHALGTGMLAQELGGGPVGAGLAKGVGYLWEGLGISNLGDPKYRQDTLHDLNANALGARTAMSTSNQEDLISALRRMAVQAVHSQPPGVFSRSSGYMTKTEK